MTCPQSSFYRYCAAHDLTGRVPTQGLARPVVDPDYTATGAQAPRTAAVVRLLLHNVLRVDEACAADIADLGEHCGHRVLRVVGKGARKAKIPLTPATVAALEAYLADRAERAGAGEWRQLTGPLLATAAGGRLRQGHLWELVRRLARTDGVGGREQLSPHCLRHSAITFARDAGASLRDVQDYAGHKDPRTTRRQSTPATAWTATPPIHARPHVVRSARRARHHGGTSTPGDCPWQARGDGPGALHRPRPRAGAGPLCAPALLARLATRWPARPESGPLAAQPAHGPAS